MVNASQSSAAPRPAVVKAQTSDPAIIQARAAAASDLEAVNQVVSDAVLAWGLPERVHRLATPGLNDDATDLAHMSIALLSESNGSGIGVAAWEEASRHQAPDDTRAVLLHGLYVIPRYQRMGIGTRLTGLVVQWARDRHFDGVIVRAWRDALPFFSSNGFQPIAHGDPASLYPRQLWKPVQLPSHDEPAIRASAVGS
jgi:GNAT superfamily N-acetyltransferase